MNISLEEYIAFLGRYLDNNRCLTPAFAVVKNALRLPPRHSFLQYLEKEVATFFPDIQAAVGEIKDCKQEELDVFLSAHTPYRILPLAESLRNEAKTRTHPLALEQLPLLEKSYPFVRWEYAYRSSSASIIGHMMLCGKRAEIFLSPPSPLNMVESYWQVAWEMPFMESLHMGGSDVCTLLETCLKLSLKLINQDVERLINMDRVLKQTMGK